MMFLAKKKVEQKKIFPLLFGAVVGSRIWDPRSGMDKNQDSGQTSRIRNTAYKRFQPNFTTAGKNAEHPGQKQRIRANAAHLSLLQENAFEMTSHQLLNFWSFFLETLAALEQENCVISAL
jgi:hypothetical protein